LLFGTECKTLLIDLTNTIIYFMYNLCGRNSSRHDCKPGFSLVIKDHGVFNDTYSNVNKASNLFATCKNLRASCRFWFAYISKWYCMNVVLIIQFDVTTLVRKIRFLLYTVRYVVWKGIITVMHYFHSTIFSIDLYNIILLDLKILHIIKN
jgi:hypothetical protein